MDTEVFSIVKRQGSVVDLTPTSRTKTEWEDKYMSVNNTTLYFIYNKISTLYDMFRPLLGHLQAQWKNRSKSGICFPRGHADGLIKVETCHSDNILFLLYIK